MTPRLRTTPQTLPVLLALVWLCAQTFLAWHAPSHIGANTNHVESTAFAHLDSSSTNTYHAELSSGSPNAPLNNAVIASQDCQFGVNGHGAAALAAITVVESRPAQQPTLYTQKEAHFYTPAQFTHARAPPTSV